MDVLALGMLTAIRKSLDFIGDRKGHAFAMQDIPAEDPATYEMICKAEHLARLRVDYIEAGFPIASQGDFEGVQAVAQAVGRPDGPSICGLSRTARKDIDRCWEAIEPAAKRRIHVFIATSESHMVNKLKMTPEQVLAEVHGRAARHAVADL